MVFRTHLGGIGTHKLMAVQAASEQLPAQPRAEALGALGSRQAGQWRWRQRF